MADLPNIQMDSGSAGPSVEETTDSQDAAQGVEATAQTGDNTSDQKVEKRVHDTEAALKERQAELTRINQEIAARKAVQEELARVKEAQNKPAMPSNPMEDPEFIASLEDMSTDEAIRAYAERSQQYFGSVLDMRDEAFKQMLKEQIGFVTDPRMAQLKDTIATLSNESWFMALPESERLAAAEKFAGASGVSSATIPAPGTTVAGTQRVVETRVSEADRIAKLKEEAARLFGPVKDYKNSKAPSIAFNVTAPNGRR